MIEHFMANREQRFLITWGKMANNYTESRKAEITHKKTLPKVRVINLPVSLNGKHSSVSCLYLF